MASYSIAPGFFGAEACGSQSQMSNRTEQRGQGDETDTRKQYWRLDLTAEFYNVGKGRKTISQSAKEIIGGDDR